MSLSFRIAVALGLSSASAVTLAQAPAPAPTPPPPACTAAEHRQFDFWVGYWDVYPTGKDKLVAHSLIEKLYAGCSALNRRHQRFAWLSLFAVAFCDVYIRLCSMGIWSDWRII